MLDGQLLVLLWVITFCAHVKVGLFERNFDVGVAPYFVDIEGLCCGDLYRVLVSDVIEGRSIPQLGFQQLVIPVKLAFDTKVRLDMAHFYKAKLVQIQG